MSLWGLRKELRCRVETPPPLPTMRDGEWVAIKTLAEMQCGPNSSTPSKTRSNSFRFFSGLHFCDYKVRKLEPVPQLEDVKEMLECVLNSEIHLEESIIWMQIRQGCAPT